MKAFSKVNPSVPRVALNSTSARISNLSCSAELRSLVSSSHSANVGFITRIIISLCSTSAKRCRSNIGALLVNMLRSLGMSSSRIWTLKLAKPVTLLPFERLPANGTEMSAGPVIANNSRRSLAVIPIMSPINLLKPPAILPTTFSVSISPILPSTMKAQASLGFKTTSCAFQVFKLFASISFARIFGLSRHLNFFTILSPTLFSV